MKKNDTKLLVEEWRRVLNDGLYDSDPEVLEEGWKENLAIVGLALSATFGNIKTVQSSPTSGQSGVMYNLMDKAGGILKADSLYKNEGITKQQFDRVYKQCFFQALKITKKDAGFQEKIEKMRKIPPLSGQISAEKASEIVIDSLRKALDNHCDQIFEKIGKPLGVKLGEKVQSGKGKITFSKDDTDDLGISYSHNHLDMVGVAKTFLNKIKNEILKQASAKSDLLQSIENDMDENFREAMEEYAPDDLPTNPSFSDAISNFFSGD